MIKFNTDQLILKLESKFERNEVEEIMGILAEGIEADINPSTFEIDINPKCKMLKEENIEIHIGSHSDRKFLREFKKSIPKIVARQSSPVTGAKSNRAKSRLSIFFIINSIQL